MARVFLSYSVNDRPIASRLRDSLRGRGVDVWWDQDMRVGSSGVLELDRVVRDAAAFIVLITPHSLGSRRTVEEWSKALLGSKRVIPALAGGARFENLPGELARINGVELDEDFERAVQQIVDALSDLEDSHEPSPSEYVDIRSIVEDVVQQKLVSLGVDRTAPREPLLGEDPRMVFVVMSFQADMEPTFEAIEAAARAVGLRAERVKDVPGDYRITDKILTSIRRAGLVIVDLTHERPNVYFELGFARGLGKTVITIMRVGTKPHFDVQDWTYVPYIDSRPLERTLLERFTYELEQRA